MKLNFYGIIFLVCDFNFKDTLITAGGYYKTLFSISDCNLSLFHISVMCLGILLQYLHI